MKKSLQLEEDALENNALVEYKVLEEEARLDQPWSHWGWNEVYEIPIVYNQMIHLNRCHILHYFFFWTVANGRGLVQMIWEFFLNADLFLDLLLSSCCVGNS